MSRPVPVLDPSGRWRRRLDVPPRSLDVAKCVVLGLDGDRNRDGDEAVPLNVDFLFAARVGMAPAPAAARLGRLGRLDGGFDVDGDDLDLGFGLRLRLGEGRRGAWRRRLFYHGAGLLDGRGRRTRWRGGRTRDEARDLAAGGEKVGLRAGEVQALFGAVSGHGCFYALALALVCSGSALLSDGGRRMQCR